MNYFEKLFKNRFDNGRSEEGVNPDELWADISSLLPPEAPKSKASPNSRFLLLLLVLLCLAGVGSFFYFGSPNQSQTIETPAKSIEKNRHANTAQSLPIITTKTEKEPQNKAKTPVNSQLQPTEKRPILLDHSSHIQNGTTTVITESSAVSPIAEAELDNQENDFNTSPPQEVVTYKKSSQTDSPKTTIADDQFITPTLALPFIVQSDQPTEQTLSLVHIEEEKVISSPTIKAIQLGLFSGINIWKNKFPNTTDVNQQLTQANDYSLGNTFAAELHLKLGPNIGLVSGIAYNRTHHQFNLVQSWDTLMYRDNVPGNDLINALATRTIKNYNSLHFLSIPILISSSKSFNKLTIGFDAGVSLNYVAVQNGKTLNSSNEVVAYPSTESAQLPYSDFFIAYQCRPFINYQLSDKIKLQLRPEISFQQFGQSDLYNTKHQALLMGLSLGGLYSL